MQSLRLLTQADWQFCPRHTAYLPRRRCTTQHATPCWALCLYYAGLCPYRGLATAQEPSNADLLAILGDIVGDTRGQFESGNLQPLELAERVREAVAAAPFDLPAGGQVTVTVSIGIAEFHPAAGRTDLKSLGEALIARADAALYDAKAAGRDRVVVAAAAAEAAVGVVLAEAAEAAAESPTCPLLRSWSNTALRRWRSSLTCKMQHINLEFIQWSNCFVQYKALRCFIHHRLCKYEFSCCFDCFDMC